MAFGHKNYEEKCSKRSKSELKRELEELDSGIAAAGVTTGVLVLAIPVTMGLSAVGIGATGPAIYELRKRRAIVRKFLNGSAPMELAAATATGSSRDTLRATSLGSESGSTPTLVQPKTETEQLPEYTPADGVPDERQKQVYVPVEEAELPELPPAYDEAVVRRTSTKRLSSAFGMFSKKNDHS